MAVQFLREWTESGLQGGGTPYVRPLRPVLTPVGRKRDRVILFFHGDMPHFLTMKSGEV